MAVRLAAMGQKEKSRGEALFIFMIVVVFLSLASSSRSNFSIRRHSARSVAILSISPIVLNVFVV